jgi:crotonobetaine/carnitine-CoA ligase
MNQIAAYANIARRVGRAFGWLAARRMQDLSPRRALRRRLSQREPDATNERSFADLLEMKAEQRGEEPFLMFYDRVLSLAEINRLANRVAHRLKSYGASPGQAAAVMMNNSPEWLAAFYAIQKLGMCAVPVNTSLRGESLQYILDHSETRFLFVDHDLLPEIEKIREPLHRLERVAVNTDGAPEDFQLPDRTLPLGHFLDDTLADTNLNLRFDRSNICLLMYTSGTTGLPKGVVYTYDRSNVTFLGVAARIFYEKDDIPYTCLPLFHANALFLTVTEAMWRDLKVGLGRRFSASRFWDEVRMYRATTFNSLGAMTAILMKQPPRPDDRDNPVRLVLTAACPASLWRAFEQRFGVTIYEGYGAVDGGGFVTFNLGNAPVGSIGKPLRGKHRIVDEAGSDVPPNQPGELIAWVGRERGVVSYYKNEKASNEKVRDGWLYTGDVVYADEKGFLYFVGRSTESMRRRGENVSAYEVERDIEKHPDVLECAAYGIPSELGEDDIMISVVPLEGKTIDPHALHDWAREHLPRFAVPRYINVLDELPKTATHRVVKKSLVDAGVTETTVDCEKRE